MGSVSLKLPASRRRQGLCSPALLNLLMLLSLLSTNLLAFFAFFAASPRHDPAATTTPSSSSSNLSAHVAAIALEIGGASSSSAARLPDGLPPELLLFLTPHALPLGRDARTGLTHMPASVAAACLRSPSALALLSAFMSYAPHSACPRNATLPRRLISKGCEPLPRRRCLSRGPRTPLQASGMGLDHRSWAGPPRHGHEFLADDVLRLGGASEIRIGLDVAGGAANFAARMRERGITVVTSVLDAGGKPMNEFVAARGLFPLLLSPAHRFPFYDGVFDLVHVGTAALDEAGAPAMGQAATPEALEFFMFDVDRVLRAGGLLWIDSYLCQSEERRRVLAKLIEKFAYKRLKWVVGEKAGAATSIYLSAVLRKPARG